MTVHARIHGIEGSGLHIPIQYQIWRDKYRFAGTVPAGQDRHIEWTWSRIAKALAQAEKPEQRQEWMERFYGALRDFKFLPGGRIIAGAGTGRAVTLFNCFVMGTIPDSVAGIFAHLREAALTMQQGGGVGMDFSSIRPKGAKVKGVAAEASGPLSFMDCWDSMCKTIESAGARRGAMMGTLRCDHPDIEAFIEAKRDRSRFRNFNVSMLATAPFMEAVKADAAWDLVFGGEAYKTIRARELFAKATRAAYDSAEPGVLFIDRVNALNNLAYCETIAASNPCGEQFLPPYGACLLGSINLAAFVEAPFGNAASISQHQLGRTVRIAVRMLDNVIDVSRYPLPEQEAEAKAKRRIGLGITGLADALAMCRLHYGTEEARSQAGRWMRWVAASAYEASIVLAAEKGSFPALDTAFGAKVYAAQEGPALSYLGAIGEKGIRNSHLLSIAPTGTISLLAGNVSGGIEPIFDLSYERKVLEQDGSRRSETVEDFAWRTFQAMHPGADRPDYFVTAHELSPHDHLAMQAAVQPYIDSAISKTVNCPADMPFEDFQNLYLDAYEMGLKGCAAYRPNEITGAVLTASTDSKPAPTVSELEALLNSEDDRKIEILPDGSIRDLDAGRQIGSRPSNISTSLGSPMALAPREDVLQGSTYKLKWPGSEHAIYVTINDASQCVREGIDKSGDEYEDFELRPHEIFINTKSPEHAAWTVALTRMISAIFRRGGDITFVADELKQIFDPRGGAWMNGQYVPSLLAAIGGIIERHFEACGMGQQKPSTARRAPAKSAAPAASEERERMATGAARSLPLPQTFCPRCSMTNIVIQSGCKTCRDCGWSSCS